MFQLELVFKIHVLWNCSTELLTIYSTLYHNCNVAVLLMHDMLCYVIQRGWISNKSMVPFDVASFSSRMVEKNLSTDQHYLEALVEGCRIARHGKLKINILHYITSSHFTIHFLADHH